MNTLPSSLEITTAFDCLVVRFPGLFNCLSWAPWNGGEKEASAIVNRQVDLHSTCSLDTIDRDFHRVFQNVGVVPENTIGLMTAANVKGYRDCFLRSPGLWVHAVATVGLSNARSVLDEADVEWGYRGGSTGTANLIVATNALPSMTGYLQSIHTAASAKAAAFRDAGVKSRKSDRPAELTGTDCLVIAASGEVEEDQCGLHTILGQMIGRAVYQVVFGGISGLFQT